LKQTSKQRKGTQANSGARTRISHCAGIDLKLVIDIWRKCDCFGSAALNFNAINDERKRPEHVKGDLGSDLIRTAGKRGIAAKPITLSRYVEGGN
jgi:hypothetical protein